MIKKISYYLLSSDALYTLSSDALDIIALQDITPYGIQVLVDRATASLNKFDIALKRDMVNPLTQQIIEADEARDNSFLGFKAYVGACHYKASPIWQEASDQLKRAINRYGSELYDMAYAEESSSIDNLLGDLNQDPLSTYITTIEATSWRTQLEVDQNAFKALRQQQNVETETGLPTIVETRKPLINDLRALLTMIGLQAGILNDVALNNMVSALNNLIDTTMTSARQSQSLSEPDELEIQ